MISFPLILKLSVFLLDVLKKKKSAGSYPPLLTHSV